MVRAILEYHKDMEFSIKGIEKWAYAIIPLILLGVPYFYAVIRLYSKRKFNIISFLPVAILILMLIGCATGCVLMYDEMSEYEVNMYGFYSGLVIFGTAIGLLYLFKGNYSLLFTFKTVVAIFAGTGITTLSAFTGKKLSK